MNTLRLYPIAALFLLACTSVCAQQKGELWEITMSMEADGKSLPAMTQQNCQLPTKPDQSPAPPMEPGCQMTDSKQSGNKFTFKYACDNAEGKYTGSGEFENMKDTYKGTMTSQGTRGGRKFDATMKMAGKKMGVCDYVDKAKQAQEMIAGAQAAQKTQMDQLCRESIDNLNGQMIFPSPNMPPEAMMCKDRKNEFCAKAKAVSQSMTDPAGYDAAISKFNKQGLEAAGKSCGFDLIGDARGPACQKAIAVKNWQFARNKCPTEIAKLRLGKCDVAGKLAEQDQALCDETGGMDYTAINAKKGNANPQPSAAPTAPGGSDAAAAGQSSSGEKPAEPAKGTSATDKLKESTDKLKKFLKF